MTALEIIRGGVVAACRPWARYELSSDAWRGMAAALPGSPGVAFAGLWADTAQVHALLLADVPLIVSVPVEAGLYAALSPARPGAALFERAVADLWGHQAADAVDTRPWLDHGAWPMLRPLSERPAPNAGAAEAGAAEVPEMMEGPGETLGFGPLPPVPAGTGHWRVGVEGGVVRRVEARLGYGHRGVPGLMRGKSPGGAARVAARIAGGATVAHSVAFARAVEAAQGVAVPPRAEALRTALLAIERVAMALHDLGAERAREAVVAACGDAFGHRLLMGTVWPGGVAEPVAGGFRALVAALDVSMPSPRPDGRGVLPIGDALALGVAGAAGRASGRLDPADPGAAVRSAGDAGARLALRAAAVPVDAAVALHAFETMQDGPVEVALPHAAGEGLGVAKGPQGRVWHWVRLSGGVVAACFAVDPAWLHLPAFERAARGAALDDLPGIAASFGLHLPGMEL